MNKYLLSLSLMLLFTYGSIDAKSWNTNVCVTNANPGTLSKFIGELQKNQVTDLVIEGAINGSDFRYLREMAGSDYHQQPTEGRLRSLDLSRTTFVSVANLISSKTLSRR